MSSVGETPLDAMCGAAAEEGDAGPILKDPLLCAAFLAAFPHEAFAVPKGTAVPLLALACSTPEGAADALAAVCKAHESGSWLRTVDPAFLPKLLHLSTGAMENASAAPAVKAVVDRLNTLPGPLALLLFVMFRL